MAGPRAPGVDLSLHYQVDVGGDAPRAQRRQCPRSRWDGQSFQVLSFRFGGVSAGREKPDPDARPRGPLSGPFASTIGFCIRTFHDSYHGFPDIMLFDLATDPHEQDDLAGRRDPTSCRFCHRPSLRIGSKSAVALLPSQGWTPSTRCSRREIPGTHAGARPSTTSGWRRPAGPTG